VSGFSFNSKVAQHHFDNKNPHFIFKDSVYGSLMTLFSEQRGRGCNVKSVDVFFGFIAS
jgi:hypothetical protein